MSDSIEGEVSSRPQPPTTLAFQGSNGASHKPFQNGYRYPENLSSFAIHRRNTDYSEEDTDSPVPHTPSSNMYTASDAFETEDYDTDDLKPKKRRGLPHEVDSLLRDELDEVGA